MVKQRKFTREERKFIEGVKRRLGQKQTETEKIVKQGKFPGKSKSKVKRKSFLKKFKQTKKVLREGISRREMGTKRLIASIVGDYKKRKRVMSPQDQARLRRLQRLKQVWGMSNLSMRDAVSNHDLQRKQMEIQSALKNKQLSPNTREMLNRLLRIQTAGPRADSRQQRINRERAIIQNASALLKTPLLKAPPIFGKDEFFNILDMENNILRNSENILKDNPEFRILRKRRSILDTGENTLRF